MTEVREVSCRPRGRRVLWFLVGLGAVGAGAAVVRTAYRGPDGWLGAGVLCALVGLAALHQVTARVGADAGGLHSRTLLRRRSVPWPDVADLRVHLKYAHSSRVEDTRRVGVLLRDGHRRLLPLPRSRTADDPDFDTTLDALRALHRRYGVPESSHVPVVTHRTAGRGWAGPLSLCALLLAGAGAAAWFVPDAASDERAWKAAVPCTVGTPVAERDACLSTGHAVIERTVAVRPKKTSWLYFADGRPLERLAVPREAAEGFQRGDRVQLTFWRGAVVEVATEVATEAGEETEGEAEEDRYVWRAHLAAPGEPAALAAALVLAAGFPAARVLLRLRGRRLPDDEVLPSAVPFAGALVGTALWLLPLCYLHPTSPLGSPGTITWAAAGASVTAVLFGWAWRATRVRTPGEVPGEVPGGVSGEASGGSVSPEQGVEVFLAARFLEHTDYNPRGFGTHVVLGDGPPAVIPHSGPGRFAARRIPAERLTVTAVRRVRGSDGETVSGSWHIAELDDAGTPVRLAAAPADLTRVLRALDTERAAVSTTTVEP